MYIDSFCVLLKDEHTKNSFSELAFAEIYIFNRITICIVSILYEVQKHNFDTQKLDKINLMAT